MVRFMIVSFGVLAWVFWELSGGADFVPEQRVLAEAELVVEDVAEVAEAEPADIVSRTDGLQLARISADAPALLVQQAGLTQTDTLLAQRAAEAEARAEEQRIAQEAEPAPPPADLREVAGSWVNLRTGPGTSHGKITALPGGTEVEVLEVDASGWARLRVVETDLTGWMAERLLTDGT